MANRKKTGVVRSAVRRSRSRQAGPIKSTAGFGTKQDAPHSITRLRSTQEARTDQRVASLRERVIATGRKGLRFRIRDGQFLVEGPFWSDAFRQFRLEFYQFDIKQPGTTWGRSLMADNEDDIKELARLAKQVTCRADWLALEGRAIEIAKERQNGVAYRTMLGRAEKT